MQIVAVDKHEFLWRLQFFHDNLCTVRRVQAYSVYRHSCLSCLTGSAVLSVERTERQNSAYRWTCSHYPALASPTQRHTQTNTGNYAYRLQDIVTVKLKLSAGVHIEECGVRPRRGQVAWAWAGDSGGPDIGPGPQSSDNTGTAPWPMPRIKHRVILDKIRSHVAVSHDNDCDTHPVWAG